MLRGMGSTMHALTFGIHVQMKGLKINEVTPDSPRNTIHNVY